MIKLQGILEELPTKRQEYYNRNKDEILKKCKEYRQKNRDKVLQSNKKYRETHKQEIKEHAKEYFQKNKARFSLLEEVLIKRRMACKKWRDKNKDRRAEYFSRPDVLKKIADNMRRRRKENPEAARLRDSLGRNPAKQTVMNKVRWAVESGKLKKLPCVVCGNVNSQGHHRDYLKPLEVIWLCQLHHKAEHKRLEKING